MQNLGKKLLKIFDKIGKNSTKNCEKFVGKIAKKLWKKLGEKSDTSMVHNKQGSAKI